MKMCVNTFDMKFSLIVGVPPLLHPICTPPPLTRTNPPPASLPGDRHPREFLSLLGPKPYRNLQICVKMYKYTYKYIFKIYRNMYR